MPTRRLLLAAALAAPSLGCAPGRLALDAGDPVPRGDIPLALLSYDWHTDVVFRTDLLDAPRRAALMPSLPVGGHIAIGFGARPFMMDDSPGLFGFVDALIDAPGAIAVSHVPPRIADAELIEDLAEIRIDAAGFRRLLRGIEADIARDGRGQPLRVGDRLFRRARVLFESPLTYGADFTCSTWIAERLRGAGLPFETAGIVWPAQLMRQAHQLATLQQGSA